MADKEEMQLHLNALGSEVTCSKEKRTAIESLIIIFRNILKDESNEKYRMLNIENPAFFDKVWKHYTARCFMKKTGWQQCGSRLLFTDGVCLRKIIDVLLDNRLVAPSGNEWLESKKYEGKSEEQLREEELKQKAMVERDKELEECLKDKKYREDLAKSVRAEHRADMLKRRVRNAQVGNKLTNGAVVKTLYTVQQPNNTMNTQ